MDYIAMLSLLSPESSSVLGMMKGIAGQFPGSVITSTVRTPEHNKEVGGVWNSQHVFGTAQDAVISNPQKAAYIKMMKDAGFEVLDEGDHIHSECPPSGCPDEVQCPEWVSKTLCPAYKVIATPIFDKDTFGDTSLAGAAKTIGIDAESLMWRITFIVLAVVLLALGILFILKKPVIGTVKGIAGEFLAGD